MPVFVAALLGGLVNVAGSIVGRVMLALGLTAITYTGLSSSLDWLLSQAVANTNGLPAQALAVMALLKVGPFVSIVASAVTTRLVLQGLTGGSIRRLVGM